MFSTQGKNITVQWWVLTRRCGDPCAIYIHRESLSCIPEINICHLSLSKKKKDEYKVEH